MFALRSHGCAGGNAFAGADAASGLGITLAITSVITLAASRRPHQRSLQPPPNAPPACRGGRASTIAATRPANPRAYSSAARMPAVSASSRPRSHQRPLSDQPALTPAIASGATHHHASGSRRPRQCDGRDPAGNPRGYSSAARCRPFRHRHARDRITDHPATTRRPPGDRFRRHPPPTPSMRGGRASTIAAARPANSGAYSSAARMPAVSASGSPSARAGR